MVKMRTMAAAGVAVFALWCGSSAPARAQEPAWCAYEGGRNSQENCGYYTFEQCLAAIRGVGGSCRPNPRAAYPYSEPGYYDDGPPVRRGRRYY